VPPETEPVRDDVPLAELAPELMRRRLITARLVEALNFGLYVDPTLRVFNDACAYITGSIARDEAGDYSDLDLFVVDCLPTAPTRVDRIGQAHFLTAVDEARESAGLRPFSRGGAFLEFHSFEQMADEIGGQDDDSTNRFTARLLLLLNSRPFINISAYEAAWNECLKRYWRQQDDPEEPYYPVYLTNDIRRWWHYLAVEFERNNPPQDPTAGTAEKAAHAERRLNNLKLRYPRLLAAYTPILGMLHASTDDGISRDAAAPVLRATPVQRLEEIRRTGEADARSKAASLLHQYNEYLEFMDKPKEELLEAVMVDEWHSIKQPAYQFGDDAWQLMRMVGEGKTLFRYCVI
jgi:hypothetical protein